MVNQLTHYLSLSDSGQLLALLGAAFFIGAAKAGLKGFTMLAVPLLALNFGTKASTGLLVPILIVADVLAVLYYRRDANWTYVWRLLPAAVVGVILAVLVGDAINEDAFRNVVAAVILFSLLLIVYLERYPLSDEALGRRGPAWLAGLAGGFTTMIGNVGGPVMSVFLLSMRLPKREFLGTGAYFFLLINLVKFPFHYFVWKTATPLSLLRDGFAIPAILLGFGLGLLLVNRIPERTFRYFVIGMTAVVALRMLLLR